MNSIENFFLDLGLSWSLSKAIPYLLFILSGFFLALLSRKIQLKKKWIKHTISTLLFALPFTIYFTLYPIYEGDLTNQGFKPKSKILFPTTKTLTVVVLPDCPYCHQSIPLIDKIKTRNPKMNINFWVVSSDSLPAKSGILSKIPSEFKILQRHDVLEISQLTSGTFPCFVLSDKKKVIQVWNNNQFGVRAIDEIEAFF